MPVVWRAIRMLQLAGLTVVSVVADGASSNGKFFLLAQNLPTSEIRSNLQSTKHL